MLTQSLKIGLVSLALSMSLAHGKTMLFAEDNNDIKAVEDLDVDSLGKSSHASAGMGSEQKSISPETNSSKSCPYTLSVGISTFSKQDFDIESEAGSVELKSDQLRLGVQRDFKLKGYQFSSEIFATWSSMELDYQSGQGTLKMKPSFTYGLGLEFPFMKSNTQQLSLKGLFEKGDFEGNEFTDQLNLRAGLPFDADIELTRYKLGIAWEKEFTLSCASQKFPISIESSLYYSSTTLDMNTGWFINTPAKMRSEDHIGANFSIASLACKHITPKIEVNVGDVWIAGLCAELKY